MRHLGAEFASTCVALCTAAPAEDGAPEGEEGDLDLAGLRGSAAAVAAWPGRMSTARGMLAQRAAVKRRREAPGASGASAPGVDAPQGGGPSDASSSECDEVEPAPPKAQRQGGSDSDSDAPPQRFFAVRASRAHWRTRYGVPDTTWTRMPCTPAASPFAVPDAASHPHLVRKRRAHASLTSGDGFAVVQERYTVPPLSVLCVRALAAHLPAVPPEDVGTLPGPLRRTLVHSVAAARALNAATCSLFLPLRAMRGERPGPGPLSPEDALELPDCSGVDDGTLREALALAGGHLHSLTLGHCGRCFTDRTVAASTPALAPLARLDLGGAYALSDTGLAAALQCTSALTSLALHAAPKLTAASMDALPTSAPALQALLLSACHGVGDVALGVARQRDGVLVAADEPPGPQDTQLLPYKRLHSGPAPLPPGCTLVPPLGGGVLGLGALLHLELAELPLVTDALFDSWAAGGALRLRSLVLRRLQGITDHTLHVLGGRAASRLKGGSGEVAPLAAPAAPPVARLTTLVLDGLPNVTDRGLRSVARCLGGDTLRLGLLHLLGVHKEPSVLRCLRAATGGATPPAAAPAPVPALLDLGFGAAAAPAAVATAEGGGLRRVELVGMTAVGDASLALLRASPAPLALRHVDLSWCRAVSDAGVGALADACPRLLTLRLWGNTQLTAALWDGVARAKSGGEDGGASQLHVEGRPGERLPPPEFEAASAALAAPAWRCEVRLMPGQLVPPAPPVE